MPKRPAMSGEGKEEDEKVGEVGEGEVEDGLKTQEREDQTKSSLEAPRVLQPSRSLEPLRVQPSPRQEHPRRVP